MFPERTENVKASFAYLKDKKKGASTTGVQ
jgi:hypothetical protein